MQRLEKGSVLTWGFAQSGLLLDHGRVMFFGSKDPLEVYLGEENLPSSTSSVSLHIIPTFHPYTRNTPRDDAKSRGLRLLCAVFLARAKEGWSWQSSGQTP